MKPLQAAFESAWNWAKESYAHLRSHGLTHWLIAGSLVTAGVLISDLISENEILIGPRYCIYNKLQQVSVRTPSYFGRTVIVQIGDADYWKGDLARRSPLKRTYLAQLLEKIASAEPDVIGLDVDLSSQTPDQSFIVHPDYCDENYALLETINKICHNTPVVLPRRLISPHHEPSLLSLETEEYVPEPSIYDYYTFDSAAKPNLHTGYVSLPYDIRQVPLKLKMKSGAELDSFAAAVARTVGPRDVEYAQTHERDGLPYGTFLVPQGPDLVGAGHILEEPDIKKLKTILENKIVLVGGVWHEKAYGRGQQVDMHLTPVGQLGGVLVQANYIEALLSRWTSKPMGKKLSVTIEVALSVLIALIFAWQMSPWRKLGWLVSLSVALIFATYISWQNLGLFFDFSIPLLLLGSHSLFEKVRDWRKKAKAFERQMAEEGMKCAKV